MTEIKEAWTREGVKVSTPTVLDLASDPYVRLSRDDRQRYFAKNGYVVVRGLIPKDLCGEVIEKYRQTCKPNELKRRAAEGEEGFANNGYLVREIFFRPSASEHLYQTLEQACNALVRGPALTNEVANLVGPSFSSGTVIYFESSSGTRIHRDVDPDQAEEEFIGAWIALRDISHESARLFVCPWSHKLEVPSSIIDHIREDIRNVQPTDIKKNGVQKYSTGAYENAMSQLATANNLEFRVPIVNVGDVILLDKRLFHGSLSVPNPQSPRDNLVAFYSS